MDVGSGTDTSYSSVTSNLNL
jgi:hypothetical protein